MKYCFLDLETTGLDYEKDSILELSFLIQDENGRLLEKMDQVVVPTKTPLTPYVTHLTGISEEEVRTNGVELASLVKKAGELIDDAIIVGHNIDFDIRFLIENGIDVSQNPRIDTHELARIVLVNEESYALEILSEKYGFSHHSAHRAMSDVEACQELFVFLQNKIAELPTEFLQHIRPFLETKTSWVAKTLFLSTSGVSDFSFSRPEPKNPFPAFSLNEDFWKAFSEDKPLFVQQGDSLPSAQFLVAVSEELATKGKKSLIISPKLAFFPGIKKFPIPEVLFAPDRFETFLESKASFDNTETAFVLKCQFRHFLGFRGVDQFDLFANERALWPLVRVEAVEHSVFKQVVSERMGEATLTISPEAFFRFRDIDCLNSRTLLIDESEDFAETLLFAPAKTFSLFSFLEKEETSVAAQFFVTRFCKDVLEPVIGHTMSPFPQKVLLPSGKKFPELAQSLRSLSEEFEPLAQALEAPPEGLTRWASYFPESGNLTFGLWEPQSWNALKKSFSDRQALFLYRHPTIEKTGFARIFLGIADPKYFTENRLLTEKELTVPPNLESANSPQFNSFCAEKIKEIVFDCVDEDHDLVVNFSSLETLKKVFSEVSEPLLSRGIALLGESASGGAGKMLQLLLRNKKKVFFSQKFLAPELTEQPFVKIVIQKFPFSPPHPLLDEVKSILSISGQSLWDVWTVPQVMANLSRRTSVYPQAKEIIWLDPRQNASWGRDLLDALFPHQ